MFLKNIFKKDLEELQKIQKEIDQLLIEKKKIHYTKFPFEYYNSDLVNILALILTGVADISQISSAYRERKSIEDLTVIYKAIGDQFYNVAENNKKEFEINEKLDLLYKRETKIKEKLGIR